MFSASVLSADVGHDRTTEVAVAQPLPVTPTATRLPSGAPATAGGQGLATASAARKSNPRSAPPAKLSVPQLSIDQRLIRLQVKANRQLEVPKDYDDIGWWATGPVPGDRGAAVLVGHVDSKEGPAVFYRLSKLREGATISVRRADKTTVTFAVSQVRSYPKGDFPNQLVYRTTGRPALHLLTCGGVYDPSTGYRDNVVVFADLVTS